MRFLIERCIQRKIKENFPVRIKRQQEDVERRNFCFQLLTRNVMNPHIMLALARITNGLLLWKESVERICTQVMTIQSSSMEPALLCTENGQNNPDLTSTRGELDFVILMKDFPTTSKMINVTKNTPRGHVYRISGWWWVVQLSTLSLQTRVEVVLGCDNNMNEQPLINIYDMYI